MDKDPDIITIKNGKPIYYLYVDVNTHVNYKDIKKIIHEQNEQITFHCPVYVRVENNNPTFFWRQNLTEEQKNYIINKFNASHAMNYHYAYGK